MKNTPPNPKLHGHKPKISLIGYLLMLRSLCVHRNFGTGLTPIEFSRQHGRHYTKSGEILRGFHELGLTYVLEWVMPSEHAGPYMPRYATRLRGDEVDAPHPTGAAKRRGKYRPSANLIAFGSLIRALQEAVEQPATCHDLAETTGLCLGSVQDFVRAGIHEDVRMLYVGDHLPRTERLRGDWIRCYAFGFRKADKARPARKPVQQVWRDQNQREKERRDQLRMVRITAGTYRRRRPANNPDFTQQA